MDILTLIKARKDAEALVSRLVIDVEELEEGLKDIGDLKNGLETLSDDVEDLKKDIPIVNEDGDVASKLIINALRQHMWQNENDALICEEGTKTLTNTKKFPFNDSKSSVSLSKTQKNNKYIVIVEVTTVAGNIGDINVSDKLVNGFKVAFTGGANSVTVKYYVIGGFIK